MTTVLRRAAPYWWRLAATGLVLVVAFGALLQGGVLAPKLNFAGGVVGSGFLLDGRYFYENPLRNDSWSAWTITGVHLSSDASDRVLPDGTTVKVALMPGRFASALPSGQPRLVSDLTVLPGQDFSVLLFYHQNCPTPSSFASIAAAQAWARTHPQRTLAVKAYIDVATALGDQTPTTTFHVSCVL
jgi:hypothetical protein